jgi:hypothetical protein
MDTSAEIRFDNWTLRGQPRELLQDGARVRLQEQPLKTFTNMSLFCILRNPCYFCRIY